MVEKAWQKASGSKAARFYGADIVISNADMWFTETQMLDQDGRLIRKSIGTKSVMAPSAFIMYLGVKEKLPNLVHHNLLFSEDWRKISTTYIRTRSLPLEPSLYAVLPSVTDPSVAPEGKENLFVLVPIASDWRSANEQKDGLCRPVLEIDGN